ncbi:MAG: helix-turn-helix transcriptional regulator [Candidatus Parcubacteria bacterium]|nr:helix-turn-helix transcriptional regulator [Burkholderiales bacterium]
MGRLRADIVWRTDGPDAARLDPRLLDLLRALQRHATLRAAAEELGLSYRAAWGLLLDATALAGAPLAELQRGRGARLTRFGLSLVASDERLREAVGSLSDRLGLAPQAEAAGGAPPLRLVASHDPLLAEFCDRFARPAGLVGEVSFRGSEASLALYSRGSADIAGFHIDQGSDFASLRRYLKPRRDQLVRFAGREQGLIVAAGNPKGLSSMADVARKRARFVNRQKGAGTRLLVDRMLRDAHIAPERIHGYGTEEYTHMAVAATIATGRADAGLGVRVAASQLGLGFVPLVEEDYWLALREPALASAPAQQLLRALASKQLSRLARGMPGYDLKGTGTLFNVEEAFT